MKTIKTDTHLLLVDDSPATEIKEGDYYIFNWHGEQDIQKFSKEQYKDRENHPYLYKTGCVKIIAASPKLGDLPEFETLPPDFDNESLAFNTKRLDDIFIVQNTKGGKEGNLIFTVCAFNKQVDAELYCKDKPHLQWISCPYSIQLPPNTEDDVKKLATKAYTPKYKGGDAAMLKYLIHNIKYPSEEKDL